MEAKEYAFLLLKYRLRTEKELSQRLKRKKFDQAVITETLEFLKNKGFVNDAAFAKAWVNSRINKPIGLRRLRVELTQKGVDKEIINTEIARVKEDYSEEAVVAEIARSRFQKLKGIEPQKAKRRVYAYLLRRGFSPEIVIDAVNQF